jgi:hypothetical protein
MTTLYKYTTGGRDVTFVDDADAYDAETIRKHWQSNFPELGNCQAETKAASKKEDKLKETTAEGQEVEVDKVVTFVKKVGTKGLPDDDAEPPTARTQAQVRAWEAANADAQATRLVILTPTEAAELRRQITERATALKNEASEALGSVQAAMTAETPMARTQAEAWVLHSDPQRKRLIDAAPKMLAALREAKETLETILEVAVFYNGNRQVVIDRLARLERAIAEATGEGSDGN